MLKFWSKTQAVVALSSAEAELGAAVKASQEVLGMMSLWKDIHETTQGHLMEDASAAIGVIRRMEFGKVRHLNTSWLWVQEKEASRELQYHKAKGSSRRHSTTTASGDTFAVNNLSATLSMKKLAMEMERRFWDQRENRRVWTRTGAHSKTCKTTQKGLAWKDVAYRVTADARSGDIINIEDAANNNRDEKHRPIEGGPRDLVTVVAQVRQWPR